jgi:hypothetical protein
MEDHVSHAIRSVRWMRLIARILISGWAAFWVCFFGAYLIGGLSKPITTEALEGFAVVTAGLAFTVIPAWLAWRKEKIGGIVLICLGSVAVSGYLLFPPLHLAVVDRIETAMLLGLVPFVTGALLLMSGKKNAL